jgi:hypothetical protein
VSSACYLVQQVRHLSSFSLLRCVGWRPRLPSFRGPTPSQRNVALSPSMLQAMGRCEDALAAVCGNNVSAAMLKLALGRVQEDVALLLPRVATQAHRCVGLPAIARATSRTRMSPRVCLYHAWDHRFCAP